MSFSVYKCVIKWISKVLLRTSGNVIKHAFRRLERNSIKLVTMKSHLRFNETCLNNELLPKYTNIRMKDNAARDKDFVKDFRRDILLEEIRKQKENVIALDSEVSGSDLDLRS